jgi:Ca2+-binding RTX toxin-like protein
VPKNDAFGTPKVISGASGSLSGSNVNASKQSSEPYHAGSYGGSSVWYSWTASSSGSINFDTLGSSFDTLLGIYTGATLSGLSEVASNDDCAGSDVGNSCVTLNAVSGTTYKIAVDGYNYVEGNIALKWGEIPCTITGTAGADTLTGTAGNDSICGLGGDDIIKGQGGNDTINGGAGFDTVSYLDATTGVIANLTTGTATGQGTDTLRELESITGSPHSDKLDGDAGSNVLRGVGGTDGVWGQAGNDQVYGGDGADTVGPGTGDDTADGGIGGDTAHFAKAAAVSVDLTVGTASGEGADTLAAFENVTGSSGADTLRGGTGINLLQGNGGNDTLLGFGGNDKLYGAAGNDSLTGGDGTDLCDGGTQSDTATTCETKVSIP